MEVQVQFMTTRNIMKLPKISSLIIYLVLSCVPLSAQDWKLFDEKDKAAIAAERIGDYATAISLCNQIINMSINEPKDNDSRIKIKGNAYFRLGHYYLHAHHFDYDIYKAIDYFEKAAEYKKEHARAELYLSMIYNTENYGVKDLEKSFTWIKRGAERCAIMTYLLAEIYDHGQTNFLMNDTVRTHSNGQMYASSNTKLRTKTLLRFPNIIRDKKKAYLLYLDYFEHNSCYIEPLRVDEYDVAVALMDGTYLEKDYTKAFEYLRYFVPNTYQLESETIKKHDEKIADGLWRMSILYRYGLGTIDNEIKAKQYLKYAAEYGSEKAKQALNINN